MKNSHFQTVWGRLVRRRRAVPWRTQYLETADDDFLELRRVDVLDTTAPTFLLLHGLEGSTRSHYVSGMLRLAAAAGWQANLLLFRTCGSMPNRQPRSYHSGETTDLDFVVGWLLGERPQAPVVLAGVSLGANVLLKWLGERGRQIDHRIAAATAISTPFDLASCSRYIDSGLSRVYSRRFLRGLKRKAAAKLDRFPGLADAARVAAADTLWAFDDAYTSVVHGFLDAADYYQQSSSIRYLDNVHLPTLLLSAEDDPFCPPGLLAEVRSIAAGNPMLCCEFTTHGGHAGFVDDASPLSSASYAERRAIEFGRTTLTVSRPRLPG